MDGNVVNRDSHPDGVARLTEDRADSMNDE
jgi:hypothetical protein